MLFYTIDTLPSFYAILNLVNIDFKFISSLFLLSVSLIFLPAGSRAIGDVIEPWTISNNQLIYPTNNFASFVYSNYVYALNGSVRTGYSLNSTIFSSASLDGSLSAWSNINANTPDALIFHTSAVKDNKVYILGGKVEPLGIGNSTDYVWKGDISNVGKITNWTYIAYITLPYIVG